MLIMPCSSESCWDVVLLNGVNVAHFKTYVEAQRFVGGNWPESMLAPLEPTGV